MDENHLLLGQFCKLLQNKTCNVQNLERFLKTSGFNLDYQIPCDNFFEQRSPWYYEYSALHFAAEYEREDFIESLLFHGADYTLKTSNSFTSLRLSVEKKKDSERTVLSTRVNDVPVLRPLLTAHIQSNNPTNPSCNDGISHFHIACLADNVPVARFFLESGVSVNESVNKASDLFPGFSPLHFAVRYGGEDLVKLLLTHGADLNRMDGNNMTPLHLLVQRGIEINDCLLLGRRSYDKNEIEQELLRNDSLIKIFITDPKNFLDDNGLSFFHASCTMKDSTFAERLLKSGADVSCKVSDGSPMWSGYTPAHFAAHCNPKIFKMLVENGADILAKDAKGITPFDLFIERHKPTDVSDALKLHPTLGCIRFENGIKLIDAIRAMAHLSLFSKFVCDVGVNSRLPENSPLWPGYTFTHLAVAMSKVNYLFRHDYFVRKDHSMIKKDKGSDDNDAFVRVCLYFKANLTIQDVNGMTALHLAFRSNKKNIVDQILHEMTSTNDVKNCVDQEGLSHLQIACIADRLELVDMLLGCSFDPDSPLRSDLTWRKKSNDWSESQTYKVGSTLCHLAALNDSEDMIVGLASTGAQSHLVDADGLTALQVGFLNGCSRNTLSALLWFSETDKTNYTAERVGRLSHLHVASYARDYATVERLATDEADVNAPIECKSANNSLYADKIARYDGWTPLHFAVSEDFSGWYIIIWLISRGADVRARTADGLNALHLALQISADKFVIERLYKELKKKGEWPDHFGLTRLHVACILKDEDEVKSLIEAGEDVNRQIDANSPIRPGDTPLHISINSSDRITILLLEHGANSTLKNAENFSPLHHLWKNTWGSTEDLEFVIATAMETDSHFYKVNPKTKDGLSHFHICCMSRNLENMQSFLDSSVDIDESVCPFSSEYAGYTPLHIAVRTRNYEVVELLLKRGVNWRIQDSTGCTPIHLALIMGCPSTLEVIFSSNANTYTGIQTKNVFGHTAMQALVMSNCEHWILPKLLDDGFRINFVDPPAVEQEIAETAWMLDNDFFQMLVERATDVTNISANGKNVVHSFASFYVNSDRMILPGSIVHCASNVKLWLDQGCDLDLRDTEGRTPLHDAASTGGLALDVLLLLGADVNIRDNQGNTAFSYLNDDEATREVFLQHILKMSCSGLGLDNSLDEIVKNEYSDKQRVTDDCNRDLARMELERVTENLSLRDLLTEKMVAKFRHFNVSKRQIILDFLRFERLLTNYQTLGTWNNLFSFQYRKILHRPKLLEPAKESFYENIYRLPFECIEIILESLSNFDLERLIKV